VLRVEIVFALPQSCIVKHLSVPQDAVIADALTMAAQDRDFLGIDLRNSPVGVFGKVVQRDQPLRDGDRIEIYRPLAEEPKLARRKRASRKG
jgi:hypothetical protein